MKKVMLFISVLTISLLLSGCGKSKSNDLVCTMSEEYYGIQMDATATIHFNSKDIATKIDLEMIATTDSEETAASLISVYESSYDSVKQDGNKVVIKETMEPDADDEDVTREEAKQSFEEEGYTCK